LALRSLSHETWELFLEFLYYNKHRIRQKAGKFWIYSS